MEEKKDVYSIEINLDDDFANARAYHIDDLRTTMRNNLKAVFTKEKRDRWVVVAIATSREAAREQVKIFREGLCKARGVEPYGAADMLDPKHEKHIHGMVNG